MQEIIIALALASAYFLFALGMSVTWGTIGILNFGHGAIFMFSVFVCSTLLEQVRMPLAGMLLVAAGIGAVLSSLAQLIVFGLILARTKDRKKTEMQVLIAGIGIGSILLAVAQHKTEGTGIGLNDSSFHATSFQVLGATMTSVQAIIIVAAIVLGVGIAWWLRCSRHGIALRAIGVDDEAASMMGANRYVLAAGVMGVAGALAGVSGILFTLNVTAILPETGDTLMIKGFAVIILGGVGSTLGVAFGSLVLAGAEVVVLTQTNGLWVDAICFGLIIAVLVLRPRGVFGRQEVRRT